MELSIGGGDPVANPSASAIASGLASLDGNGDSFAILGESELRYIQAAGSASEGFVLEYQLGSLDLHYRSLSQRLPLELVTRAFQAYAVADPAWQGVTAWQRDDLDTRDGPPLAWALGALAALLAAAVWWLSAG